MPGNKKVNSNLNIDGKISVSTVPNLGTTATYILTQNSSTKEISQRTDSEIISDFGIASNSWVSSNYIPKTHPVYNITQGLIDYWAFKDGTNATGNWANTSNGLMVNPTIPGKHKNTSGDTSLANATYGEGMGYINTASTSNGNPLDAWFYRLKFLHNNSGGYYGEFAIQMTDGNSAWYKRYTKGTDSGWIRLLDTTNGVTLNTTQTITGHKVFKANTDSCYDSSIELIGNGSTIPPGIGFHQPGITQSFLYLDNSGWLNLKHSSPTGAWGSLAVGALTANEILSNTFKSDGYFGFYTNSGGAQALKVGGLTVTDNYVDNAPAYGIFTKGLNFLNARPEHSGTPTISLAIGDNDTGFNWEGDGVISYYSNSAKQFNLNNVWHQGNDGAGSGLDADLLDGKQGNQFINLEWNSLTQGNNVDYNEIVYPVNKNTWYIQPYHAGNYTGQLNTPPVGGYGTILTISGTDTAFSHQLVIGDEGGLAIRSSYDSNKFTNPWVKYWSTNNFSDSNINNWNAAYGWGNHATQGYLKSSDLSNYVTTNTNQTITGAKTFNSIINFSNNVGGIQGTIGDNDYWRIIGNNTASNAGYLEIATADDGTEPIIVSQYFGEFSNLARRAYLLDESGNTSFPGTVTAPTFSGNLNGNAATATNSTNALRITFNDGPRNLSDRLPNSFVRTVNFDFVSAGIVGGVGNYAGVMTFSPWDGTTNSTGDSSYQLAFLNETGINGTGLPGLALRKGIDSTWGGWYNIAHSGNVALSYSGNTLTLSIKGTSVATATINAGSGVSFTGSGSDSGSLALRKSDGTLAYHTGIYNTGSSLYAAAFYETSLRKYKINIEQFNKFGLDLINKLDIVTFDKIDGPKDKIGIIADDSPKEFLSEKEDAVDLYNTIFIQAKAIQELTAKNLELEERLIKLEKLLPNG